MANRLDWNALEQKISLTMSDWPDIDTRSKALIVVAMSTMLDVGIEEAIDSITDGGNDRGVDALFVDNRDNRNDVHILQSKCVDSFQKSKSNFPGAEVDKITSFVSDLLLEDMDILTAANHQLQARIMDAIEA